VGDNDGSQIQSYFANLGGGNYIQFIPHLAVCDYILKNLLTIFEGEVNEFLNAANTCAVGIAPDC
jgi:hypothetical protein